MTFETWCEEIHHIDHMTFTLRHPKNQEQIIEEWNEYNQDQVASNRIDKILDNMQDMLVALS